RRGYPVFRHTLRGGPPRAPGLSLPGARISGHPPTWLLRRRTFERRWTISMVSRRGTPSHRQVGGRSPFTVRPPGGAWVSSRNSRGGKERSVPNVEAHITGTVWKIEVEVGDTVEEGDTVVILESMKMEMPVEAEDEGRVAEILCQEGQSVSEGDPLVELE